MTEKANPSINRSAEAFKTAGAIALAGGAKYGWVSKSSNPSEISVQDPDITESNLNAFNESHSTSSFDVTIQGGEAFIFGSWLAKDTNTTVTLTSNTTNQTVYVGWNKDGSDDVIVGFESVFATAAGDTDKKIPLFDFDTDGSGVTAVNDRRTVGKTIDGRSISNTVEASSDFVTDGEQIIFADSSSNPVTITLNTSDLENGNNVIVIDAGGNAKTNPITVTAQGSSSINNSNSVLIETDYGAKAVAADGSNWYTSGAGGAAGVTVEDDGTNVSSSADRIDFGGGDFDVTSPTTGEAEVALTNESVTVTAGTGLTGGGTVSLGDSVTVDVDPADDEKITFGTADDFTLRYDSANDDIRLEDNGTSDRLALDRTTGDLSIEGTLTEGATL